MFTFNNGIKVVAFLITAGFVLAPQVTMAAAEDFADIESADDIDGDFIKDFSEYVNELRNTPSEDDNAVEAPQPPTVAEPEKPGLPSNLFGVGNTQQADPASILTVNPLTTLGGGAGAGFGSAQGASPNSVAPIEGGGAATGTKQRYDVPDPNDALHGVELPKRSFNNVGRRNR